MSSIKIRSSCYILSYIIDVIYQTPRDVLYIRLQISCYKDYIKYQIKYQIRKVYVIY